MNTAARHIALVCNPTPSNARSLKLADSISILLHGMDVRHTLFTAYWPTVWDDITEAWIIGGDGTLNWFINQYPHIHFPLSIFPGGTGNDFHWMLYGECSTEEQVEKILEGQPFRVDTGICNDRLFLNGVGIGFDGAIVKDMQGKTKLSGKASYLLSIIKHLAGYHEKPCELVMPGETIRQDCFMVSVANGRRYGGGFNVAPRASLTDGLLDINIIGRIPAWKRLKYIPVIEKGEHLDLSFVQYRQVNEITIFSPQPLHAHMDGEYFYTSRFSIKLLPEGFSFLL